MSPKMSGSSAPPPSPLTAASPPALPLPAEIAQLVADTMFALSTPSRLQILACLRPGPMTVSEIVDAISMEQSAVSHQLRVLRDHSLLSVQRVGRQRRYSLRDDHVAALVDDALAHAHAVSGRPLSAPRTAPATAGVDRTLAS